MAGKYALLIGNGTFEDPAFEPLRRATADVDALQRVLGNEEIGGFQVTRLVDADSLSARKQIASLFKNRTRDDVLLLFYAGHGVKDDHGELHLVMRDTGNELLSATAIRAGDIAREMDRSRSDNQILILDCCFSGAFEGARGSEAGPVHANESFQGKGTGRVILTASDAYEYAWEHEAGVAGENSVFTTWLVKGLESGEADRDGNGVVTVDEWYDYVYEQMQRSTRRQTPQRTVAGAGPVPVARSPRPPVELEPALMEMINHLYPRVRRAAVHELDGLRTGKDLGLANAAREHLRRLLEDSDRDVRKLARQALDGVLEETDQRKIPVPRPEPPPTPVKTVEPVVVPEPVPPPPQPAPPIPQSTAYAVRFGCGLSLAIVCGLFALMCLVSMGQPEEVPFAGAVILFLMSGAGFMLGVLLMRRPKG